MWFPGLTASMYCLFAQVVSKPVREEWGVGVPGSVVTGAGGDLDVTKTEEPDSTHTSKCFVELTFISSKTNVLVSTV